RLVGGKDVADYLDIIAPADKMADVWSSVFYYLVAHRAEWDAIDLHSLPQWSPSKELIAQLAKDFNLDAPVFPEDVCPVVELPGDWDTYLMSLRKKDRHELKRKVRKLEGREDVRWYLVPSRDAQALTQGMRTFLDLHRMSGADKEDFMDDQMAEFFMKMASELAGTGW